jgi:glc operon protein GlcG
VAARRIPNNPRHDPLGKLPVRHSGFFIRDATGGVNVILLENCEAVDNIPRMFKSLLVGLCLMGTLTAADLPSKKYLNLAAIKTMVAGAEAEAMRQNVSVTICIVDENGALLFLEKGDGVSINTEEWAEKKARHAALYGSSSKDAADQVKSGNNAALAYPNFFPGQGGLPIKVDGQTIGAIAASGAKSEIDEAIAQAGIDALLKK